MKKNKKQTIVPVEEQEMDMVENLEHTANWGPETEKKKHKKKLIHRLAGFVRFLCVIAACYLICVYSQNPFITKWRTLYIETAMGTMTHQWLATYFIPPDVVNAVVADIDAQKQSQADLASTWEDEKETETEEVTAVISASSEEQFYEEFWEVNTDSFKDYIRSHPEVIANGYENLDIEDLDLELGLVTVNGDQIMAIDAANHILLVDIRGDEFVGKLAICKNASQVDLAVAEELGEKGDSIMAFGENNDAVVAINASRFTDPGGHGTGAEVAGSLVIDGVDYGHPHQKDWKYFGMKYDNRFYITNYSSADITEYRWAIECLPALIVNGQSVVDGSFGMGIQPRSTVGQCANGDTVYLVVDGRQVGYSLGCTVADCTDIMLKYGVTQAADLDGGSSSVMWYKGQLITKSSSASGTGRYTPDALIFRKATDAKVQEADEKKAEFTGTKTTTSSSESTDLGNEVDTSVTGLSEGMQVEQSLKMI